MKKDRKPERSKDRTVIPLEDLAPLADPKGGAGIPRVRLRGEPGSGEKERVEALGGEGLEKTVNGGRPFIGWTQKEML